MGSIQITKTGYNLGKPKDYQEALDQVRIKYTFCVMDSRTKENIIKDLLNIDLEFTPTIDGYEGKSVIYYYNPQAGELKFNLGVAIKDLPSNKSSVQLRADGDFVITKVDGEYYIVPETSCFGIEHGFSNDQ